MATSMLLSACTRLANPTDAEVRDLYARYAEAVRGMDTVTYMSFFGDDFSMQSPDGKVHDRAEMAKYQRVNAQTTKKVRAYAVSIEVITRPSDSEVAVIVVQKYDRDQAPLEQPDRPHRIQTSAVQRETWRQTKQGLRIWKIEELLVGPVFIDGKLAE